MLHQSNRTYFGNTVTIFFLLACECKSFTKTRNRNKYACRQGHFDENGTSVPCAICIVIVMQHKVVIVFEEQDNFVVYAEGFSWSSYLLHA